MKYLMFMFMFMLSTLMMGCDKEKIVAESDLPDEIVTYLKEHFSGIEISQVIKDKDGFSKHYEVRLADGTKLEFNRKNEIKEIESSKRLPDSVIPAKILTYVLENYPDNHIVKWELDSKDQQVGLNNGLELEFDLDGNFLRID